MKDFILKYFGRILAILGCSTLVTACYGVPYDEYAPNIRVNGRVVDSETDLPIKGINVRVVPSDESLESDPYDFSNSTDSYGYFNVVSYIDTPPSGYIVECTDVDGDQNGSYESVIEEVPSEESSDIVIKMAPKRQ